KTVYDFFPRELAEGYHADDLAVQAAGVPVQDREEVIVTGGQKRYHSSTKVPLRDWSGKCAGLVVISRDVTAQRQAEQLLARERNLLRTLIENLPDHIFVKDTQSRFVLANRATLRSLGAESEEEVIGKTDFDFLPRDRAEQFFADEQRLIQSGQGLLNQSERVEDARREEGVLRAVKVAVSAGGWCER